MAKIALAMTKALRANDKGKGLQTLSLRVFAEDRTSRHIQSDSRKCHFFICVYNNYVVSYITLLEKYVIRIRSKRHCPYTIDETRRLRPL